MSDFENWLNGFAAKPCPWFNVQTKFDCLIK